MDPVIHSIAPNSADVALFGMQEGIRIRVMIGTHRILLPVRIEESDHSLRLLKRLNQTVQQPRVEAPVTETNSIFMIFVKGVHGALLGGQIPGAYRRERLSR
jgi:hypothetical protein